MTDTLGTQCAFRTHMPAQRVQVQHGQRRRDHQTGPEPTTEHKANHHADQHHTDERCQGTLATLITAHGHSGINLGVVTATPATTRSKGKILISEVLIRRNFLAQLGRKSGIIIEGIIGKFVVRVGVQEISRRHVGIVVVVRFAFVGQLEGINLIVCIGHNSERVG